MKFNEKYQSILKEYIPLKNQINHEEYPKKLRDKSVAELKYIIKDAQEAIKANPDSEKSKSGYYEDEINYASMELKRRENDGKDT